MATRLRVLHTADWHLGHTLHERPREVEHDRFLAWLVDLVEEERVDALLVAGDVFQTSNPPASAQRAWFEFLATLHRRVPHLAVVVTAGNHDSAARLDAPAAILRAMDVHVVGGLPRRDDDSLDLDRLVVPLAARDGQVAAYVAAVPFLRPSDLRPDPQDADAVVPATRRIYDEVLAAARARCTGGEAVLAMGHCYMVGGQVSELSERRVQVGNQLALPADLFPDWVHYVALGHLHRSQRVGGSEFVRYSGSPIPLSMDEAAYEQQVCLVDLEAGEAAELRFVPVPRTLDLLRLPEEGPLPLDRVLRRLGQLPARGGTPEDLRPLLEVRVAVERPQPDLAHQVEQALDGRLPRLVRLAVSHAGTGTSLAEAAPRRSLADLQPLEVFRRCYERSHGGVPPGDLEAAFHQLLESVQQEEA